MAVCACVLARVRLILNSFGWQSHCTIIIRALQLHNVLSLSVPLSAFSHHSHLNQIKINMEYKIPTIIYSPRGKRVASVSKAVCERARGAKRKRQNKKIRCIFSIHRYDCRVAAACCIANCVRASMHLTYAYARTFGYDMRACVCAAPLVEWWSYLWTCATAMARREKGSTRWRSQFTRPTNDFATAATNPMNTKLDRELYKYNRCRAADDDVQHTTGPP